MILFVYYKYYFCDAVLKLCAFFEISIEGSFYLFFIQIGESVQKVSERSSLFVFVVNKYYNK